MTDADAALLNARLVHRRDLTPELAIIRVAPEKGDVPAFEPGQYATLGLPPEEHEADQQRKKGLGRFWLRPYSIVNAPGEDALEFYLALVDGGALTPKLWPLHEGDRLWMSPKCKGTFTLTDVPADRTLVTIATGTGLAPFLSMLKHYRGQGRWRRFVVIHGARYCPDLGYRDELEQLAAEDDTLRYIATCSREPEHPESDWQGLRGRVNVAIEQHRFRELAGVELDPAECHVFLCGNPQMIDDLAIDLRQRGFVPRDRDHPDGNIHFEKYW